MLRLIFTIPMTIMALSVAQAEDLVVVDYQASVAERPVLVENIRDIEGRRYLYSSEVKRKKSSVEPDEVGMGEVLSNFASAILTNTLANRHARRICAKSLRNGVPFLEEDSLKVEVYDASEGEEFIVLMTDGREKVSLRSASRSFRQASAQTFGSDKVSRPKGAAGKVLVIQSVLCVQDHQQED